MVTVRNFKVVRFTKEGLLTYYTIQQGYLRDYVHRKSGKSIAVVFFREMVREKVGKAAFCVGGDVFKREDFKERWCAVEFTTGLRLEWTHAGELENCVERLGACLDTMGEEYINSRDMFIQHFGRTN